jgi:aryl-alcohol dehydrogenase-like predicted oxidoreductase
MNSLETRRIGSLQVSVVGLGCNNFGNRLDAEATAAVVDAALDAGVTFFDTADIYAAGRSEEYLGRALGSRRDEVVLATKFGNPMEGQGSGASADYVKLAVESSLRRLGTDRIDLYQLHRPDPQVPIAETLDALAELVRAGKVREIGCSNFSLDQLREAEQAAQSRGARFVSVQNRYNMLDCEAEHEILLECERQGLAFLPYSPLANGLLTGKVRTGQPPPEGTRLGEGGRAAQVLTEGNLALIEELIKFAQDRGHSLLDLAVSWLLSQQALASVIAGATKPEQVRANVAAAGWQLTGAELAEIDNILSQPG